MELRYYFTHCVKGDDGGWVSRDMRYPLSTHFSVLDSNPAPGGGGSCWIDTSPVTREIHGKIRLETLTGA